MKSLTLDKLFIDELEDMYSAENQIIESLPKMIKAASFPDLKEGLSNHLLETKMQVERLEKIFALLGLPAKEKRCKGMEGILKEGDKMLENQGKNATIDAAIISAAQKVEHYEIASYGALCSFAKYLELDGEIIDLLQENLKEEKAADKALTGVAEGGMFTDGINKEAAEEKMAKGRK